VVIVVVRGAPTGPLGRSKATPAPPQRRTVPGEHTTAATASKCCSRRRRNRKVVGVWFIFLFKEGSLVAENSTETRQEIGLV